MRRVVLVAWLTALWVVLWRDLSVANVVSGMAVALVALWAFRVRALTSAARPAREHTVRPLALARFAAWFAYQLVVSNLVVAREVVSPRDRIRSGIVEVPVAGSSDLVITVVADAISLTPGTLTLEVRHEPPALYVHVLHLHDIDRVRRDILHLQWLVVQAIGSRDAVRRVGRTSPRRSAREDARADDPVDRPAGAADDGEAPG